MLPQDHVSAATPVGATLVRDGATFRVWAPRASAVYLHGRFGGVAYDAQTDDRLLAHDGTGYWTGFQPGAADGDPYRFWVVGVGGSGHKRDPYARELAPEGFPDCFCILRAVDRYPWHDAAFRAPDFSDMVVYQLHIGTYAISRFGIASNFLDVAAKVPYLAALGINVLQPLPIDEQETNPSMGYGGADLFSPDFPYVATDGLPAYLEAINGILAGKALAPLTLADISSGTNQLKVLVDLCHVHGIAVMFDVVYNHAGGFSVAGLLDDNCLYYFDRARNVGDNNDSLYFTNQDRGTGGLAFALWNGDVCRFLQDNAARYVAEYHADGFRYDEISILLSTSQATGWAFCRELTSALRGLQPRLLQNAEFWPGEFNDIPTTAQPIVTPASLGGAGFDVVQHDALRSALRGAVGAASAGAGATLSMVSIAGALYPPGFDHAWRAVTCIENHDLVMVGRSPRIPMLADGSQPRSWYARSRARVANAILLTAPGIPQLFMGQEFLEEKPWGVDPAGPALIGWAGLENTADITMADHLRFTQDVLRLRRTMPALRDDNVHPYYVSDTDRVLAYHRWIDGVGADVIVVATFAEATWWGYSLGFPFAGPWREIFNSDVYDNWVNPQVAGNGGGIDAAGGPLHGFVASASIVIPANGVVVFARS
ncbi:MAG TPA: alpha amylase C-terminal domain-containing protein [Rhodopila sp.]|uniref:alpha amylase C-terminal domain-containing protein n=1 Tax=Rhodopila sp. TaxID=2480087 RepID=UPI002C2D6BEB|nr:alpha amylase C-terminal domain-containing protein [Rhodopila sp.]HVY17292.1 alpha amylase C-terminal domain-containing protein [Rhodopila sp.]